MRNNSIKQQPSNGRIWVVSALFGASLLLLVMCNKNTNANEDALQGADQCVCGTLVNIEFGPKVPGDNKLVTGQLQANCFAWQEFVSLNWPTSGGVSFGAPGNTDPVQWETYMTRDVLLNPDGTPPPPWRGAAGVKAPKNMLALVQGQPSNTKLLFHQSKFKSKEFGIIDENGQAFPTNAPNWLGAQNGTNIWYEVLVNEDEYNYIVQHGFYNADSQYAYVALRNQNMDLPEGNDTQTGAIELKASWMEVTNPADARWNRYKLSKAILVDPQSGKPRPGIIALIGLHILHKTASQPTWFWATFEHIDNVPGSGAGTGPYNLHNPNCQDQQVTVPGGCGKNPNKQDSVYTVTCKPNQEAPYYLCPGAGPSPMQVTREIPIDSDARAINQQMQAFIAKNFPGSVWANYQLVNMIWSTTPQTVQNNLTPQGLKSMQPLIPVANTAAETFIQNTTCFGCHQFASIAPTAKSPNNSKWSSDFSFVFGFAGYAGKQLE